MVRDTTERKRIEAQAIEARQQAERAAEAQGQFLATMSHGLRTPLNSIVGFSDPVLARTDLPVNVRRQIGLIQTASDTLLTVVNDVLDYSKIEEGKLELTPVAFDLRSLIEGTVAIVRGADVKALGLQIDLAQGIAIRLVGDDQRIRQILFNLLSNAIKFTHDGSVSLRVTVVVDDQARQRLRLDVVDTGIGIAPDKIERLFQRLSQVDGSTSRDFGGSGLGLAISKRLVEMMNGAIGVNSVPGHGSTFWFELSLPICDADRAQVAVSESAMSGVSTAHLLLVEDIAVNREIAAAVLGEMGYTVDVACDGAEAVAAVQEKTYDLVLMDIQMPGMDGITATRRIRALSGPIRQIPIVAMTANVLTSQIEEFHDAGMNGHIGKPFRRDDLRQAIEPALPRDGSRHQSDDGQPQIDRDTLNQLIELLVAGRVAVLLGDLKPSLQRFATLPIHPPRTTLAREAHGLISTAGCSDLLASHAVAPIWHVNCRTTTAPRQSRAPLRTSTMPVWSRSRKYLGNCPNRLHPQRSARNHHPRPRRNLSCRRSSRPLPRLEIGSIRNQPSRISSRSGLAGA